MGNCLDKMCRPMANYSPPHFLPWEGRYCWTDATFGGHPKEGKMGKPHKLKQTREREKRDDECGAFVLYVVPADY